MKKFIFTGILLLLAGVSNSQFKTADCVAKLNGFTFLKTYKLDNPSKESEFSYVFSKDNSYIIIICSKDGNPSESSVSLFDANKNMLASSYDEANKRHYYALAYNCKATGMYYMKFKFDKPSGDCSSVLAFKR
ncbi:MAG: hypothetical protein MUF42_10825 [Cytophagaceae bacterium]|jgi:hypothetical protein|nr:hypothetical protein [Cytophagaceae bacterium]